MKVLKALGYIVIWFILFNVLWYFGGWLAFRNLPEEVTIKYLLWAGISDFLIFDSIMVAIGLLPVLLPGMLFKDLRITPIICGLLEVAYCVYLIVNGSNSIWAYILVILGAVVGSLVGFSNKKEEQKTE